MAFDDAVGHQRHHGEMAIGLPSIPRSYDIGGSVLQASALLSSPSLAFRFAIVLWPGTWRACTTTIPQVSILPSRVLALLSFCSLAVCLHTVLTIMSWYNHVYSLYDFVCNSHRHAKFFSNFSMWGTFGIASIRRAQVKVGLRLERRYSQR